jgi:tRNA(Arg) A34 adenosine deaminase TadA
MRIALDEAREALRRGEVPVGAVITTETGVILAQARNRSLELNDPTAHAELLAIREAAAKRSNQRLADCDIYVSLEPCAMCAAAISFARLRRLYFGASDVKMGAVENGPRFFQQQTCHHRPDIYGGIAEGEAAGLLKSFFAARR